VKQHIQAAEPSAHSFTTATEATDTLAVEVEPDEMTCVKCKIGMGIVAGRPNLSQSTKEEFDGKSVKLKLQDLEKMAKKNWQKKQPKNKRSRAFERLASSYFSVTPTKRRGDTEIFTKYKYLI
jgi:hypothetical protein